jgi:hypothetical protein
MSSITLSSLKVTKSIEPQGQTAAGRKVAQQSDLALDKHRR